MLMESLPILAGSLAAAGAGVFGNALFNPRSRLFGPLIWLGTSEAPPRAALTFDDGPHPTATDAIIDTLEQHSIRAAFFLIGANVMKHPDVVRRIHERGHLIGNHSFDHANHGLCHLEGYWFDQIEKTDQAISQVTGQRPTVFRPPMGFKHRPMMKAMRRNGHTMVNWSRRGRDGLPTTSDRIINRLADCGAGDIALLHDGVVPGGRRDPAPTVAAVGPLIERLKARGVRLVRLDELVGLGTHGSMRSDAATRQ